VQAFEEQPMRCQVRFAIVFVGVVVACRDATRPPVDTPRAALVPGEYWEVTNLVTSSTIAWAGDINDAGVIVGYYEDPLGVPHAFRWQSGLLTTYPTAPGTAMTASGINASGQIVGSVRMNGVYSAYVRNTNGSVFVLPHVGPADEDNSGFAINDLGVVGGGTESWRGVRWSPTIGGWTASPIGVLLTLPHLHVRDINNSGWIVGSASEANFGASSAFVQRPGHAIELITSIDGGRGIALSINNSGKVLGGTVTASGEPRYFSWTSFGGAKNETGAAYWNGDGVISDKGRIAGIDTVDFRQRAITLYEGIHTVLPLGVDGRRAFATGINSCGVIVGMVSTNAGLYRAVRWRRVAGTPPLGICD
jgi:probable HAF family extracellular repeat protein